MCSYVGSSLSCLVTYVSYMSYMSLMILALYVDELSLNCVVMSLKIFLKNVVHTYFEVLISDLITLVTEVLK